ncbi:MAG: hypothetical protein WCY62_04945 [Clostridia bacterium]|jgi:hypothetical protein
MNDKIFTKYNELIQKSCERDLEGIKTKNEYFKMINDARMMFESTVTYGVPVREAIDALIAKDGLEHVLDVALTVCDMYLPISLISAINREMDPKDIMSMINDRSRPETDRATLINVLIDVEDGSVNQFLMDLICTSDCELIKEEACEVFSKRDRNTVRRMIRNYFDTNGVKEDLIAVLVNMYRDEENKDDVYTILKDAFIASHQKPLVANMLADLGDGRAVVFLRGYILKNINSLEKDDIIDIAGAIFRLGGKVDDFLKPDSRELS